MSVQTEKLLQEQNKLLQDLIRTINGSGGVPRQQYSVRSSRGVGADNDGDSVGGLGKSVKTTRDALKATNDNLESFRKGLRDSISLYALFDNELKQFRRTLKATNEQEKKTIEAAQKVANTMNDASSNIEGVSKNIDKMRALISDLNKISKLKSELDKKNIELSKKQLEFDTTTKAVLLAKSAEEAKLLKEKASELEKAIDLQREEVSGLQDIVNQSEDLVDELKDLIQNTEGVSEAFNALDDVTKDSIRTMSASTISNANNKQALDAVNKQLKIFEYVIEGTGEAMYNMQRDFQRSIERMASTIVDSTANFVRNQTPGIIDRMLLRTATAISETNFGEALVLGLDEADISRFADERGVLSRLLGGSMDRTAMFQRSDINENILRTGRAFGVRGREAVDLFADISEANFASGLTTTGDAAQETAQMLQGLSATIGVGRKELQNLYTSLSRSGEMAVLAASLDIADREERSKATKAEFTARMRNLKILGLDTEQRERAMRASTNAAFSGLENMIMRQVGASIALSTVGPIELANGTVIDRTQDPELFDKALQVISMGAAARGVMDDETFNRLFGIEEVIKQSTSGLTIGKSSVGAIQTGAVFRDIIGSISPELLGGPQDLAARERRGVLADEGITPDTASSVGEFYQQILNTAEAASGATSKLSDLNDMLVKMANIGAGAQQNPATGAALSIGGAAFNMIGSGLAGAAGLKTIQSVRQLGVRGAIGAGKDAVVGGLNYARGKAGSAGRALMRGPGWAKVAGGLLLAGAGGAVMMGGGSSETSPYDNAIDILETDKILPINNERGSDDSESAMDSIVPELSTGIIVSGIAARLATAKLGAKLGMVGGPKGMILGGLAGAVGGTLLTDPIMKGLDWAGDNLVPESYKNWSSATEKALPPGIAGVAAPIAGLIGTGVSAATGAWNWLTGNDDAANNEAIIAEWDWQSFVDGTMSDPSSAVNPVDPDEAKARAIMRTPATPSTGTDLDVVEKSSIEIILEELLERVNSVVDNTKRTAEATDELVTTASIEGDIEAHLNAFKENNAARMASLNRHK